MNIKKILDWKDVLALFGAGAAIQNISERASGDFILSLHISLVFFFVSSLALIGNRWLRFRNETFKIEAISNGNEGDEVKAKILSAEKTIHTTHTYPYVPTKSYTNTLTYRLKEKVVLFRVIDPVILDDPKVRDWLKEFNEFKEDKKYFEYRLRESTSTRTVNFTIIDREIVFLYLSDSLIPGNQDHAIEIRSKKIAESFLSVYD